MPASEHQQPDHAPAPTHLELMAVLADLDRRLEGVDAHENPLERAFKRE